MKIQTIFGFVFTSRRRKPATRPDTDFSRAFGFAPRIEIKQPTLVVNGSDDVIIDTINSYILQQNLPNAQLVIYPDSAHGSLYQYPELFVRHVSMFLSAADPWAP